MLKCHQGCTHKRTVPGNTHIECKKPFVNMRGKAHGVKNGWFMYPFLFDPIWGEECPNFETEKPSE